MAHDTAGDPVRGLKWTQRTPVEIAEELRCIGIQVGARTVARLLEHMGFALRVNHKKLAGCSHPDRNTQFERIQAMREQALTAKEPLISVDTKKKELIGLFRNPGAKWDRQPVCVEDHDFRSDADAIAVPYGVYDVSGNCGTVFIGTSFDTPEFAVDCIEKWWRTEGRKRFPGASSLNILADGGGSNGASCRAWKYDLQHRLCNRHGLTVRVAHYPPATSKWNPIEHRLFSEISKNWAAQPLDSLETILNYTRTTTTRTGLKVKAHLVKRQYAKGRKITNAQMKELALTKDNSLPKWNYTIEPS